MAGCGVRREGEVEMDRVRRVHFFLCVYGVGIEFYRKKWRKLTVIMLSPCQVIQNIN